MSEVIDGVEGEWERRYTNVIRNGERYRLTGSWNAYDDRDLLDLNAVYGKSGLNIDDQDVVEVFVPFVDEDALPKAWGIYADIDGDLWRLLDDEWTFITDKSGMTDPENYTPLHKIADLYHNFGD